MKLGLEAMRNKTAWEQAGYVMPAFDVEAVRKNTEERPVWVHMGAGNIYRAFLSRIWQEMLNAGEADTGIVAAEGFDYEIISRMYRPFGDLCIGVTLKTDGSIEKQVIAGTGKSVMPDVGFAEDWAYLKKVFTGDSLQMVSFTITEKGYNLYGRDGGYMGSVQQDIENGPAAPVSYIGKVAALLYERFLAGEKPVAMVSMDNCSHNGEKLETAVLTFARAWEEKGLVQEGFTAYLTESGKVTFPWSMIDKITPRPDESVRAMLEADGVEDLAPVVTSRNTYIAPYVNAEEAEYLVVEDAFPNGRPALEKRGIIFTDRDTVNKAEKMKVGTCLNPIHTALAIFGCLLEHNKISEEMKDPELSLFASELGYREGLPAVIDPKILSPERFLREVLEMRLPNPFMPDTPQRIATDTSLKLPIRFGETVKSYLERPDLDINKLELIPIVFAGWCRYLVGLNDSGEAMELSSDPMLPSLRPMFEGLQLGAEIDVHALLQPVLSNDRIFAVDLYQAGLAEKTEKAFASMMAAPGAVRATLKAALA